jgi:RNA polymerase sigma-70 factor (ECF subfamily)
MMSFFVRRSVSHSDAEDMTQEVFVRLISSYSHEVENVDAYIFQIAANILRDRGRKDMVRNAEVARRNPDDMASVDVFDPSRILLGRESLRAVSRCLDDLPEKTRDIFILYRVDGLQQADIASGYNISERAVRKHIAKAFEHVMRNLSDEGLTR